VYVLPHYRLSRKGAKIKNKTKKYVKKIRAVLLRMYVLPHFCLSRKGRGLAHALLAERIDYG
jgi:hypothetical protein